MKKPTFFKERKAFIKKMINPSVKVVYAREQKLEKDIFEKYPVDFLNMVKQPFDLNSLAWFLSKDGEQYLKKELSRFLYKPKEDKIVAGTEKKGYNFAKKKIKKFREFLDE